MPERDARSEAQCQFGNVLHKMEESRSVWIARWISDLVQDVSFAARTFRKQPALRAWPYCPQRWASALAPRSSELPTSPCSSPSPWKRPRG